MNGVQMSEKQVRGTEAARNEGSTQAGGCQRKGAPQVATPATARCLARHATSRNTWLAGSPLSSFAAHVRIRAIGRAENDGGLLATVH